MPATQAQPGQRTVLSNRLLANLQDANKPITAIDLAERLELEGSRETQRRHVRILVRFLRHVGHKVCADSQAGYWLARYDGEWTKYLEAVRTRARFEFVSISKMSRAASDLATGQGKLFGGDSENHDWMIR